MRWAIVIATSLVLGRATVRGEECATAARISGFDAFVCDATSDVVLRLHDADGSGSIEPWEVLPVYADAAAGPDLSIPYHLAEEDGRLFLLDGGTIDGILVLEDQDGDRTFFGADEVSFFFQNGEGPTLRTPKAFARDGDGFFVADDSKKKPHILRLADRDGDGVASGEEEIAVYYDPAQAVSQPPLLAVRAIARGSGDDLYAADASAGGVYVLSDLDRDGDANDEDEVRPFLVSGDDLTLGEIGGLLAAEGGLYIADAGGAAIWFARDDDGDGDALDPDEASIFMSGPPLMKPMDLARVADRTILAIDPGARTVFVVADLDGNGDASGDCECVPWLAAEIRLAEPTGIALAPSPREGIFIRGDVEGDGRILLNDPIQILGILFAGEAAPVCRDRIDGNDDGMIDLADPIFLLAFLFSSGSAPPSPYPDEGPDPTEDPIPCPTFDRLNTGAAGAKEGSPAPPGTS